MRCPYCGGLDTQVKDSRPTEDSSSIRRRRICPDCGGRFTTFERVQLRELMVVKKNGRRAPFDRDKLMRSVQVALRKRSVEPERIERMINGVVRQLESQTDGDIPTERIGELVMEGLKALDDVAYVRFASVYRNFREARDFNAIVGELEAEPDAAPTRETPPSTQGRARIMTEAAAADSDEDLRWMQAALNLGSRSLGLAAPNPSVGAILVKDGVVVGRGATAPGGRPHAERIAISRGRRGGARRDALCDARALLAFRRFAALRRCGRRGRRRPGRLGDRGPEPAGRRQGHARLKAAGIAVSVGAGAAQARRDHRGHILRVTAGRPCVTLKLARDGGRLRRGRRRTTRACASPDRSPISRVQVMRSTHEAIMVGIETALADDPALTVRLPGLDLKPLRVVLDTHLRLPARSRLAATARDAADHSSSPARMRRDEAGVAARRPGRHGRAGPRRRERPCRSPSSLEGARGARDHPRVQRGRPVRSRPG